MRARKQSRRQSMLSEELDMLTGRRLSASAAQPYPHSNSPPGGVAGSDFTRREHGEGSGEGSSPAREQAQPSLSSGGLALQASQQLAASNKLEDQINLQHLVELMRIFNVCIDYGLSQL